jgi:pimeloyl-ACP methyl ester carboxylesterase
MLAASNSINFVVRGGGDPTLIFVHGFGCALGDWDEQLEDLSSSFRCVALDLPGHGNSAAPKTICIETLGAAVNAVKNQIASKKIILVGHSMGCRVVVDAFLQSSASVLGLVFVDGSFLESASGSALTSIKDAIDGVGIDAFTERFFRDMFLESANRDLREHVVARAQGLNADFREKLFLDLVRWDTIKLKDALTRIGVPALVLQSTSMNSELRRISLQPGMTTPWMDAVANLMPNSHATVIPNAGHMTMIEAAPLVNEAIKEFAAGIALGLAAH